VVNDELREISSQSEVVNFWLTLTPVTGAFAMLCEKGCAPVLRRASRSFGDLADSLPLFGSETYWTKVQYTVGGEFLHCAPVLKFSAGVTSTTA